MFLICVYNTCIFKSIKEINFDVISVKTAIPMTSIVQAKNIVATTTSTQPSAPQIKITLPVTGPQLVSN